MKKRNKENKKQQTEERYNTKQYKVKKMHLEEEENTEDLRYYDHESSPRKSSGE